jgi:NAD(P)-dependent dehydrogenase (short-subunit alcohol dehydrogenase family)
LGLAIAQAVLEKGDTVIAAVRNPEHAQKALGDSKRVFAVAMDVTDSASVRRAAEAAIARFGKIDVVVNNAGYGLMGAIEELDASEFEDVFKTNFFGVHEILRVFLPILRAQRAGWIVNISSVGGLTATPGAGAYNASKFALEGLSEGVGSAWYPRPYRRAGLFSDRFPGRLDANRRSDHRGLCRYSGPHSHDHGNSQWKTAGRSTQGRTRNSKGY